MRQLIFSTVALLFFSYAEAQNVRLSYFGETFTHYGVKGAYPVVLHSWVREGTKGNTNGAFIFSPGLAVYRHPANHIGVIVMPEVFYQKKNPRGGMLEAGVSPGLFRSFLEGQTFEVTEDGSPTRKHLAGQTGFMPSVFIGTGKDLMVKKGIPLEWFWRFHILRQVPYNKSGLTRIAFEAGISKPITSRK